MIDGGLTAKPAMTPNDPNDVNCEVRALLFDISYRWRPFFISSVPQCFFRLLFPAASFHGPLFGLTRIICVSLSLGSSRLLLIWKSCRPTLTPTRLLKICKIHTLRLSWLPNCVSNPSPDLGPCLPFGTPRILARLRDQSLKLGPGLRVLLFLFLRRENRTTLLAAPFSLPTMGEH